MSNSILRYLSRPPRQLTATQSAELEVDDALIDIRLTGKECEADKAECKKQAKQCRTHAQEADSRQLHKGPVSSMTTAKAIFGFLIMFASAGLAYVLFQSMGIPWPLSLLLAGVEAALFAGVGSLAIEKLRQGDRQQLMAGAGLLIALGALAYLLVPQLAEARADEMYATRIAEAQAQVDISQELAGKRQSRSERLRLRNAESELTALPAQRERAKNIFTIVLAATLVGEMLLSSYSTDMLSRGRARRLRKKADRLEAAARDAQREADEQNLVIFQDLTEIARTHAIPLDTIGQLAQKRNAEHVSGSIFAVSPAPRPGVSTVDPPPTPVLTTAPPQVVVTSPTGPGSITTIPAPLPVPVGDNDWDGVWA